MAPRRSADSSPAVLPVSSPFKAPPVDDEVEIVIKDLDTGRQYRFNNGPPSSASGRAEQVCLEDIRSGRTTVFQYGPTPTPATGEAAGAASSRTSVFARLRRLGRGSKAKDKAGRGDVSRGAGSSGPNGAVSAAAHGQAMGALGQEASVTSAGADSDLISGRGHMSPRDDVCSATSSHASWPPSHGSVPAPGPAADKGTVEVVKVSASKKIYREFTDLRHIQTIEAHKGVVWALKFSCDGQHLASAGQDCVVRVWRVHESRRPDCDALGGGASFGKRLSSEGGGGGSGDTGGGVPPRVTPLLEQQPFREFKAHTGVVLDLDWSADYLLSSSMDYTVVLWNLAHPGPMKTFKHDMYVTAVAWHPADARYFMSACFDGRIRLWYAAEPPAVKDWKQTQAKSVTCCAFNPASGKALVGTQNGKFRLYNVPSSMKLDYQADIDVRNKNARNVDNMVVGVACARSRSDAVLVTTKDSRIRLFDGVRLVRKYKGHKATKYKTSASFSQDGNYVICGSDDGYVFIWKTDGEQSALKPRVRRSFRARLRAASQVASSSGLSDSDRVDAEKDASTASRPLSLPAFLDGRSKSSSYEAFRVFSNSPCTVACFAPPCCQLRSRKDFEIDPMSAKSTAMLKDWSKRFRLFDGALQAAADNVTASANQAQARNSIIVCTGVNGDIVAYENFGSPAWI